MTSSSAVAGATICPADTVLSATAGSRPHARHVLVERHGDEDGQAQVEGVVVGADALDDQAVLEDAQEDRADERADDRARSALQQRAADDGGRDGLEQDRVGARRIGRDR
jgi:hypothetical protein